jgi:phosphate-selective porin OprO/OprP
MRMSGELPRPLARGALSVFLAIVCGVAATAAAELQTEWKDGLRWTSTDGAVSIALGHRIHYDLVFQKGEETLLAALGEELEDGTEFRRMRLSLSGTLHHVTAFKLQYDFATGSAVLKDGYVEFREIPGLDKVRVGQFKEPFGLEELTSSNYISFVERSLTSAFVPSRNTGVMTHDQRGRVAWAAGVFREASDTGLSSGSGEYNATARLVFVPWRNEEEAGLVHLAAAGSIRSPADDELRLNERPEDHMAPRFVDTGTLAADQATLLGFEGAVVYGRASLQGEYMMASASSPGGGDDPSFSGYYALGSFFLTQDYRSYKTSEGAFGRTKPRQNFRAGSAGRGALELVARYSSLDLTDGAVTGGRLEDFTLGLNWYLNPNCRVMVNGVYADLEGAGSSRALLIRFQTDS